MIQKSTLKFLADLKKNNNKSWFDAHRKEYEAAKKNFADFVQQVLDQLAKTDPSVSHLTPRDCMFRINRDVRFSKDKSPYKTNMGAYINKGGKKAMTAGYYFHLEPGGSFAGGGLYIPPADLLKKVRQEIDYNLEDFKKILQSKKFRSVYNGLDRDAEYLLSRVPKGYEPGNPAAEFLKLKSFVATCQLKEEELTSGQLLKNTMTVFTSIQPLIEFLNTAIDE